MLDGHFLLSSFVFYWVLCILPFFKISLKFVYLLLFPQILATLPVIIIRYHDENNLTKETFIGDPSSSQQGGHGGRSLRQLVS